MWLLTRYKDVYALSRSRITSVTRVDHLLEGRGQIDIIGDVSIPVPANVIAHMLGVPSADVEAFKSWTAAVFPAFVGDRDENVLAAYDGIVSLDGFFRDLIASAARRRPMTCCAP